LKVISRGVLTPKTTSIYGIEMVSRIIQRLHSSSTLALVVGLPLTPLRAIGDRSSFSDCSSKNVEQSAAGSHVIWINISFQI